MNNIICSNLVLNAYANMKSLACWRSLIVVLITTASCSKPQAQPSPRPVITDSVADITSFAIVGMNPDISITPYSISIRFASSTSNVRSLTPSFTLSPGTEATVNGIKQVSEVTKNNFNASFYYTVTNAQRISKRWTVTSTNNDYSQNWALGNFVKQSISNDRPYKWYYNQAGTGKYATINCAPTCATMAMKWADSSYTGTVQDARDYFPQNTGLWGMGTIATFLTDHGCHYKSVNLGGNAEKTRNILKAQLDGGHILIIIYAMASIRSYVGTAPDPRVDRYYPEGDGFNHCLVIFGYKQVDDEFYFQVNDPWCWSYYNKEGTLCGNGRFYRYEDIFNGCINLNNNTLIISKK